MTKIEDKLITYSTPSGSRSWVEDRFRQAEGSLPDVTELGEPVAVAMFSDRFVDVEHMPREVSSGYPDPIDNATSRPPMGDAVKLTIALMLIVVGTAFAILLLGFHR